SYCLLCRGASLLSYSDERLGGQAGDDGADQRPEDRDPRIGPVGAALVRNRQQRVDDAGSEVSSGVDGVSGGSAQRGADGDDDEGHGQRAEPVRCAPEDEEDEDEHEGRNDLGDEVPAVGADLRAGGEGAQNAAGVLLLVVVLLVCGPGQERADHRADHLGGEIGHCVGEVDRDPLSVFGLPAEADAEGHRRVEVAPVLNATKTPAKTARPQPNEISSQPPPFHLVLVSTTLATTPTPSSMSIAVPAIS